MDADLPKLNEHDVKLLFQFLGCAKAQVADQQRRIDKLLDVLSTQDACAVALSALREPPGC